MALNKTNVKGLYLTNEGKAWHKSAKREIKATTNGKIRFNGKLYDLQKLIDLNKPNATKPKGANPKPTLKKSVSIRELQKQGFKKTKISGLFATNKGLCYNSISKRNLTTTKGKITINGKAYNVAKIILETFCKIPMRSGQMVFKNGNDKDFYFENLEYKSTIKQIAPNETDLIHCIRFYFEVDKKLHNRSNLVRYYLSEIVKIREFANQYNGKDFDLFIEYIKTDYWILSNNQKAVFDKFNYTATNGKNAINKYLGLLICECLQDFENGLLTVKGFKPKPPTKTQKLRDLQKSVNEWGLNVKIPLRKKSNRELLSDYDKHLKEIVSKIKNLENEPPK
ncbi:hypothetical protein FNW52_02930 [Flavobacterium sp. ZT3R18]|uniref:hypothetical protein n=1 Tax=Flavobacterium sp. ZT3R18 TaxID=2594429 RepID=UPI00117A325E|nr:hypothetical protein [Flavobacterium sp. ZT3R18]TRX37869.1 hypothetical protein FNW52_02930 [Flavobacterium sp. ZT3R18]